MAKAFFDKEANRLYKISTDSDVANYHCHSDLYNTVNITDADFAEVVKGLKVPVYDGTTVTYNSISVEYSSAQEISHHCKNTIIALNYFLNANPDHPMWINLNNYKRILEKADFSGLTFPYTKTLEQWCEDNSITYYHPLQIP